MLRKVTMKNFMCFGEKEVTFNNAMSVVNGQNGKGKTTVGTAILWAIFNRNYELKDNPVVRKSDVSDKSDVEVELVFDNITLRKVQRRKRNENNPTEYMDTNSYFVNEVSVTMKEYNSRISDDMKTTLMGCAINAFLSEKAETLRAYLFSHVEDVSDMDVALTDPALADIAELLKKYNLEEIKAIHKKIVSDNNKELQLLEGRIKEKERDVQLASEINVSELELKRNSVIEEIAKNEALLEDSEKMLAERQKMSDGILELKFKLSDMERAANEQIRNSRKDIETKINNCKSDITRVETDIKHEQDKEVFLKNKIEATTERIKTLQVEWKNENERVLDDSSLVCPYCGREYPEEKKETLKSDFEKHKADAIRRITDEGTHENEVLTKLKVERDDVNETIRGLMVCLNEFKEEVVTLEHQFEDLKPVDVKATEAYKTLLAEIDEKETAMVDASVMSSTRMTVKSRLEELRNERDAISSEIAQSNTEEYEKRLEELTHMSLVYEQKKTDAERILSLIDSLERIKNDMISDKINNLFGLVKFQLFEFTKSGTYKNVCIPTINGKSLLDNNSNKALKIIGKIDICNTIQKLEGIDLPIILDDGEALDSENLNNLATLTDRQIIVLRVSEDKDLVIS